MVGTESISILGHKVRLPVTHPYPDRASIRIMAVSYLLASFHHYLSHFTFQDSQELKQRAYEAARTLTGDVGGHEKFTQTGRLIVLLTHRH